MLVLTRKANESIVIGDDTVVTILSVKGDKVRIGVEAPRDLSVHRKEIYEAIKTENLAAGINQETIKAMEIDIGKIKSIKRK